MNENRVQIVMIGAGIMSATLAVFLRRLLPDAHISLFERLDQVAAESSNAMNNSGTGHAAYCELNYTPIRDGQADISSALNIAQHFEVSKQFWAFLKETGQISYQKPFINRVPHISFVWGSDNTQFLKQRYAAMCQTAIFQDMLYASDPTEIGEWAPLVMEGRAPGASLAATKMDAGTDVNFGALTRDMVSYLQLSKGIEVNLSHRVIDLVKQASGPWRLKIEDLAHSEQSEVDADYVFIGAGGGSLPLLQKSGIDEAKGYGGFPISGQFLMCSNPDVVQRHHAKVYGKAEVGTPPMSVPHLDTRLIEGRRILFFGPYAGFTTRFLKNGSYLDMLLSLGIDNIWPILSVGLRNRDLAGYLIKQVMQSSEQRFKSLLDYYPDAKTEDWSLTIAGQRVQIIQKRRQGGGELKFGTEIVSAADGSIAALLGASPGASTSVSIALNVLERMFPDKLMSRDWRLAIKEMIPTYGESLIDNGELCLETRARTHDILGLN